MLLRNIFIVGALGLLTIGSADATGYQTPVHSYKDGDILLIRNSYGYCRNYPCSKGCKWYRRAYGDPCHRYYPPKQYRYHRQYRYNQPYQSPYQYPRW
ncbi:MAG: hypothetical protein K2Y18_01175 [Alphaproteobacteria bacterium]|jgi:hypothetical protein|nr:hypothetical protein [Alphaproteobacteria bacterium]